MDLSSSHCNDSSDGTYVSGGEQEAQVFSSLGWVYGRLPHHEIRPKKLTMGVWHLRQITTTPVNLHSARANACAVVLVLRLRCRPSTPLRGTPGESRLGYHSVFSKAIVTLSRVRARTVRRRAALARGRTTLFFGRRSSSRREGAYLRFSCFLSCS